MTAQKAPGQMSIPAFVSGGVMLSYRCSNACRHCLYRCSPRWPDEWMSLEMAGRVFAALAEEPRLDSIHIAGGEPTLRMDLLEEVIRLGCGMGVPIWYAETNAFWCTDRDRTKRELERLKRAGLPALLVSASMFHNEFVPFSRTRRCVQVGREVFGRSNVIIWLPEVYQLLSRMPDDGTHRLEEFCQWAGLADRPDLLPRLYNLIPAGRAPQALRHCYDAHPAEHFDGASCRSELLSTSHFHIDPYGNLFTGLCAGLSVATADNLHPTISEGACPVFWTLCTEGPYGLMRMAGDRFGYAPKDDGYVSKCDLCYDVRKHLQATGEFPELRPAFYYTS